ncbi:MAG: uracil-DNA glycosylase [Candidatus Rokubacteria bacterium]|nr:uracil-DNA glycosylase [Candidatus Rokubacteria bacterium]
MFIAEAPGRYGADRSRVPLHGDVTGRNFEWLLASAGLSRDRVYVTNAVLCNPCDPRGRNSPPTRTEIHNCSVYLRRQLDLVSPGIIVTLGTVALVAIGLLYGLRASLSTHHRKLVQLSDGRILIPLFHPSQRVMNTRRSRSEQLEDFQYVKL